jgi:hypothetical protein
VLTARRTGHQGAPERAGNSIHLMHAQMTDPVDAAVQQGANIQWR